MSMRVLMLLCCMLLAACVGAPHAATPAERAAPVDKAAPAGVVDDSCNSAADCAVKNVGNCCGAYPACGNKDSPTFPEQVKADCAREGRMAVCGFPVIEGCRCENRRCTDVTSSQPAVPADVE